MRRLVLKVQEALERTGRAEILLFDEDETEVSVLTFYLDYIPQRYYLQRCCVGNYLAR